MFISTPVILGKRARFGAYHRRYSPTKKYLIIYLFNFTTICGKVHGRLVMLALLRFSAITAKDLRGRMIYLATIRVFSCMIRPIANSSYDDTGSR